MLPVSKLRYAKVNKKFTNPFAQIYLHEKKKLANKVHTSFVYVIMVWFGLGVSMQGTSIGFFKLSMVLRLKQPSLIKI
jgi:hypothetical protein